MLKHQETIEIFMEKGTAVARLRGEIDHHSAVELRRVLDDYICRHRPSTLCMDTSGIDFMDSSGLGLIMGRYALMQKSGGELLLYHPSPSVLRMVRLAGMERIIKIELPKKERS
jgi:stage II sporulation protein AA (anti-sigma F factor antagonist)